jgi:large subunit ribosomal protein L27
VKGEASDTVVRQEDSGVANSVCKQADWQEDRPMSHVKAGGTAKNTRDSQGQRLGVKLFGGERVKIGQVIVRQVGESKRAGDGTKLSRNYTIHAARDGVVHFETQKVRRFTGKTVRRTTVSVK